MPNHSDSDSQALDTYLAAYVDEVVDGVSTVHSAPQATNKEMEEVVRQLHAELRLISPGADVRERIRSNLTQQWYQMYPESQADSVLQQWWRSISGNSWSSGRRSQRLSTFALAGAAIVVLAFLAVLNISSPQPLPASAEGDLSFGFVAVGLGMIVAVAALLFSRRKR